MNKSLLAVIALAGQAIEPASSEMLESTPDKKVCRVLSLSGGGSKGAYEIGVLQSFVEMLPEHESNYDVITGVSVGSINAAGFGLYGKDEQDLMVDEMMALWVDLDNRKVWKYWDSPNPLHGLMYEKGLLDNSPLNKTLTDTLQNRPEGFKKKVIVAAVDANSGRYVPMAIHDMKSDEERVAAVMGSAGVPFVFPPQNMTRFGIDAILVDGGVAWNNNVQSGVAECMKMSGIHSKSQVEVDVIMMNPENITAYDFQASSHVPPVARFLLRKREIKAYHSIDDDVIEIMRAEPDVFYRYYVQPKDLLLPEYDILEFGIKYTETIIEQGKKDAKAAVTLGPGKSFDKLFNDHPHGLAHLY